VVRAAQALAIRQIEGRTAAADFPDVISEHAMLRLRLAAALAILNRLAATARPSDDVGTPFPILRCEVEWIDGFRRKPHSPRIERPDRWP
jgi:hypothetical protein